MGLFSRVLGRLQHSVAQADKLKLWCVRRWLHLVPIEELKEYYERQGLKLALDKFYGQMVEHMIKTYDQYADDPLTDLVVKSQEATDDL